MLVDPIIMQYPENLNDDRFVIATYYVTTPPTANAMKFAAALAVEQTCGTWIRTPAETDEVRERAVGRVVGIYEAPAYQNKIPKDIEERHFILQIAYPWQSFGTQFAMLLTTVIGNISSSGKVKLLDLHFPKSYIEQIQGPKFGVPGIRELINVPERPLVNAMIKPCVGLTPEATADLAYTTALGGIDVIKDDELVQNPPFCTLEDRVKAVVPAVKAANKETGEKTLYAFNITAPPEQMKKNAYMALENGAECLMINYNTVGLDATREIIDNPDINVPILGHCDYTGTIAASEWSGMSHLLANGKLPRMAGVDMAITMSSYGKFVMIMDTFAQVNYALLQDFAHIKPVFPMPGGGTTQGHIQDAMEKFGNDIIISAGGAIHGHPGGTIAGGHAMRQGIDAVMAGMSLEEAGEKYEELGIALKLWGIYKESKGGIFDLKG